MVKVVLISNQDTHYKDKPGEWYHFPNRQYFSTIAKAVGDWVVFYQSRSGGVPGYYSVQRLEKIVPDNSDPSHSFAILDRASELSFERIVPRLRAPMLPYESGLALNGGNNASAVRIVSEEDFAAIIAEGLREEDVPDALPREKRYQPSPQMGFSEIATAFIPIGQQMRPNVLSQRAFRDHAFARQVKRAYGGRCAMTGLELRNGGGRPEVEAAHIVPVEAKGPDTVRNGMALSGTVHWMFDRGLVSVDADYSILIARNTVASDVANRLFVPDLKLILPDDPAHRPHTTYLEWHRENCFKG
jgi:putative restriction endonuclease